MVDLCVCVCVREREREVIINLWQKGCKKRRVEESGLGWYGCAEGGGSLQFLFVQRHSPPSKSRRGIEEEDKQRGGLGKW